VERERGGGVVGLRCRGHPPIVTVSTALALCSRNIRITFYVSAFAPSQLVTQSPSHPTPPDKYLLCSIMVAIVCQLAETAGAVGKRKKKKEKIPENSKKRAYAVIISALSLFALISRNATRCILFGCHLITTKQTYKVACDDNCIVFFLKIHGAFQFPKRSTAF